MENTTNIPAEGGGGGDKSNPTAPLAPTGYIPLTPDQRLQWNNFLDYLGKQGLGGNPDLDARDKSLGLAQMAAYKKLNPDFSITPAMIQNIQYEQYMLRKGDSFPTLSADELKYIRNGLSPAYMNRQVSPVDNWLGSITSKLYYPTARRGTNMGDSYDFGVNFEDYVRSLNNASLAKKYKTK